MKLITAVIKPFKIDDLREALVSQGIAGITVAEVKGFGRQKGHTELYRGAEYAVDFVPKLQVDIIVSEDQVDNIIETILSICQTGKIGDGKIWVKNLDKVIRIRTGEQDEAAV